MPDLTTDAIFLALSGPGLLGTRGPLFSDVVVLALGVVVALLLGGMVLARNGRHGLHAVTMTSTWAVLSLVVVAFVAWNARGGPPAAPKLEASALYGSVYLPLLGIHICAALASLVIAPLVALLGAVKRRRSDWGRVVRQLANRHALLGKWTFGLLLFTANSGITIYWFRYIY